MKKMFKPAAACLIILIFIVGGLYLLDYALKPDIEDLKIIDFSYYEDTAGQMDVSEINSLSLQGEFSEKETSYFDFGRRRSVFWIRIFSQKPAALKNYLAVYCPNIQDVQLYIPANNGYRQYVSGWGNSAIREDEKLTYPVFRLDQDRSANQAVYLRVKSDYSHMYTIGFYNEQELIRARVIDYCLNSFLFGILFMIVIINLIIYFEQKNILCLLFAICVFLISIHQGCSTGIYNVLFPVHSDRIMQFSIEIGLLYLVSVMLFFMSFSKVKTNHRLYYYCCLVLIAACLMGYPLCLFDKVAANFYVHMILVISPVFIFIASMRLYFMGKIKQGIFLIGWNITTVTYILITLCTEGILRIQNNYVTIHAALFYAVTVSIIFTVAMEMHAKTIQMEHMKMRQQVQLASERVKRTETALLQTQIKPHFLYNTLTAIEQMCAIDSQKAQDAISDFANYLRSNIDFSTETKLITIEQELANVKYYLALEQMRFEDRLHVVYDIQAGGFMVPPLVVQPLVENAVRYGVTKKLNGGTIQIVINETESTYVISVSDNGVGFDPDSKPLDKRCHVGISNVRNRLEHQCRGILIINSKIGVGTTAVITIPKEK